MKLKINNFNWLAGRPVAVLDNRTAKKLNIRADERVSLENKKVYAVADIFDGLVNDNEIGLSEELSKLLNKKNGDLIEVSPASLHKAGMSISKKLSGSRLSKEEINEIISEIVKNNLTESEIAYFLSAEKLVGMSFDEITYLIEAMVHHGKVINFGKRIVADKHCLPFETPIFVKEDNKLIFVIIGDLVEKNIVNKNKNIEVLSWNNDYKTCFVPIKDYFKVKSPKIMQKITLRGNRSISLTEDHSIFILRRGKILNLPSKEINKGDYVLVPKGISEKLTSIPLKLEFENDLKKNGKILREMKFSKELMRFLGYYISEGFKNYQGIFLNFGSHEKELIEDSKKCIEKVFGISPTITKPHKTAVRVCIYSRALSKDFSKFSCGDCALDKTISPFIFSLNKDLQLEFLKSLFDGDGYVRRGYEAVYVTVSKQLANQLSYLLSLLGISASISVKKERIGKFPTGDYLCSESYYIYTQAREIYGGRKKDNVSFINLLPIKELGELNKEEIGWVKRKLLKNQKYITFEKLREIKDSIQEETIKKLLASDLSVLEVKSNEKVNSSSDFVYDLKTENGRFIAGFMPICIHNCIGGIAGNRTTPIVVSICAAAGLLVPKTSSRAITSASGTADVIETISRVEFSAEQLKEIVEKVGACLIWGGSLGLAPSDDKIIHVERIINIDVEPQLLASIISKKLSVGSNHILIDIPYGKEAKVKSLREAKELGNKFSKIAKYFKLKLKTVYTNGEDPIGRGIGPILEMFDVLSVLKNKPNCSSELREKSLFLATNLLELCGYKNARKISEEILVSGKAYIKFKEIINTQNGKQKNSDDFEERVINLHLSNLTQDIFSPKSGEIRDINNKLINTLARILGCPENKSSGIYLHKNSGIVKKGEKLMTFYSESKIKLKEATELVKENNPFIIK